MKHIALLLSLLAVAPLFAQEPVDFLLDTWEMDRVQATARDGSVRWSPLSGVLESNTLTFYQMEDATHRYRWELVFPDTAFTFEDKYIRKETKIEFYFLDVFLRGSYGHIWYFDYSLYPSWTDTGEETHELIIGAYGNQLDELFAWMYDVGGYWVEFVFYPVEAVNTSISHRELPSKVSLSQNYPNPFNPSTTVTYTLDRSGPVQLTVYDLTGRLVSVLADGVQPAGRYAVRFDANDLSAGTYIYRFTAGAKTLTRTMTLLR